MDQEQIDAKGKEYGYLLSVDNVEFPMFFVTKIARLEPTVGVYRSIACIGIPKITLHDSGPSDADLGWILERCSMYSLAIFGKKSQIIN